MKEKEARARFTTARVVARWRRSDPMKRRTSFPWCSPSKPKLHPRLQRLDNIRAEPRVSLLVDSYDQGACSSKADLDPVGSTGRRQAGSSVAAGQKAGRRFCVLQVIRLLGNVRRF